MARHTLKFSLLPGKFAVCRLPSDAPPPEWGWIGAFTSVTRTADELSVVCPLENVPAGHAPDTRWVCVKLQGPFSFTQVGIRASFVDPLAESGVPIFAISTHDTDYVLVSEEFAAAALNALQEAGHELLGSS